MSPPRYAWRCYLMCRDRDLLRPGWATLAHGRGRTAREVLAESGVGLN